MTHSAPDYQKAREIGSKYVEFQILAGAVAKSDRWVSPCAAQQMLRAKCRNGSWLCKNAQTPDGDRMNILRNRNRVHKDSAAHSVTLNWRKTIPVVSAFFAFLHSLGHQLPPRLQAGAAGSPP
jgi:hypothetical protein